MSNECKGIVGAVFGHNYQARYSKGAPPRMKCEFDSKEEAVKIVEASKSSTYECDVCTRCGDAIKKADKT